jgi:hypothetical protein
MTPSRQAADRRPLALDALDPTGYSVDDDLAIGIDSRTRRHAIRQADPSIPAQ